MEHLKKQAHQKIKNIVDYGGTEEDLYDLVEDVMAPYYKLDQFFVNAGKRLMTNEFDMGYLQCILDIKRAIGYPIKEYKE